MYSRTQSTYALGTKEEASRMQNIFLQLVKLKIAKRASKSSLQISNEYDYGNYYTINNKVFVAL